MPPDAIILSPSRQGLRLFLCQMSVTWRNPCKWSLSRSTSASGTKWTFQCARPMSAFGGSGHRADMPRSATAQIHQHGFAFTGSDNDADRARAGAVWAHFPARRYHLCGTKRTASIDPRRELSAHVRRASPDCHGQHYRSKRACSDDAAVTCARVSESALSARHLGSDRVASLRRLCA
jgi:hypothetical protein